MTEVTFGEWLKRQRSSRGLTQEQLAHQIGCATITLRKFESEERRPSVAIVQQLAKILEIPQDQQTDFLKFVRGDWTKVPIEKYDETPWQASESPRTNLPAAVTSLIGREKELTELRGYLVRPEVRLVTLTGPPGIGKTRLSIEAARLCISDFADGVFFAGLASLDDPDLIVSTVRQALGYAENQQLPVEQQLIQDIDEKRMLIVLDVYEPLIETVTKFASGLLSACPNLKILAASRELLRIPGEWLYAVPPLKNPEENMVDYESLSSYPALMLFVDRARAAQMDFTLTQENIKTISSICAFLDGLPLAIELIAAQIRMYSPQSLLQRMNDRFVLSVPGTRTGSSRQLSLSHVIGWSYDSLSPYEQRLFVYLSVFSGGFTLSAAEVIFSEQFTETSVSDIVASLLDKSLLQRSTDPGGDPRFRMLVSIRYFASDQLKQINEAEKVHEWHLAYFMELAEQADEQVRGPDQAEWMDRLENEMDNFRVALGWCVSRQNAESALRLLNGLNWTLDWRGYFSEKENWFNKIRVLPDARKYSVQYANMLNNIGDNWLAIDVDAARSILEECHDMWLKMGMDGERGLARVLGSLGTLALYNEENIEKARSHFEESLKLHQKNNEGQEIAWLIFKLGALSDAAGQYVEAEKNFMESLSMFQKFGNKLRAAYVLSGLGEMSRHRGDFQRAEFFWEQNLELFRELRVPHAFAYPYQALASVSFHRGNYVKAKSLFKKSLEIFKKNRDKSGIVICLAGLAAILAMDGRPNKGAQLFGAADLILESIGALEPADQMDFDLFNTIVREHLNEDVFKKAWAVGHGMTTKQVIEYALEEQSG